MRRNLLLLTGSCAVFIAAIPTTSCGRTNAAGAAAATEDIPTVAVAKANAAELSRELVLTAEFQPFQEIDVMAKVAGYVKRIYVDIGDRVRQGQLLAVLEIPEMADEIAKAQANCDRTTADVARARDELRRAESAHEMTHLSFARLSAVQQTRPGLIAQQEIDDAHSRDLVSEAQVAAAKSALAAAQEQVKYAQAEHARLKTLYNYTQVTAPFSGVITKRFADTGSMIQAGTASQTQAMPVVRLSENTLLRLVLPVPESVVPRIHTGQLIEVRVPSLYRSFTGKVARFAEKLQLATRTMETEVDVPNPNFVMVPGMYAQAVLRLDQVRNAISIPLTAISTNEGKSTVLTVSDSGRLEERPVKIGLETADRVEIRSGLRSGDLVVVGNRNQLRIGERVKPRLVEMAAAMEGQ